MELLVVRPSGKECDVALTETWIEEQVSEQAVKWRKSSINYSLDVENDNEPGEALIRYANGDEEGYLMVEECWSREPQKEWAKDICRYYHVGPDVNEKGIEVIKVTEKMDGKYSMETQHFIKADTSKDALNMIIEKRLAGSGEFLG